jgi:ribosomal protein L16 Arg81 hydroxylase
LEYDQIEVIVHLLLANHIAERAVASERNFRSTTPDVVQGLLQSPEELVTDEDLARIVSLSGRYKDAIYVSVAGNPQPRQFRDQAALEAFVAETNTTVMYSSAQRFIGPVKELCDSIEEGCKIPIFATIFVTPAGQRGLNTHWDEGSVGIAQLAGQKEWWVHYPVAETLQEVLHARNLSALEATQEPFLRTVLSPGKVLFVPRGWPHATKTVGGKPSRHLSIGMFHGDINRKNVYSYV